MPKLEIRFDNTPGRVPTVEELDLFKFGYNTKDGKFYGLTVENGNREVKLLTGSGVSAFTQLLDTFTSYTGLGGFMLSINMEETGLEAIPTQTFLTEMFEIFNLPVNTDSITKILSQKTINGSLITEWILVPDVSNPYPSFGYIVPQDFVWTDSLAAYQNMTLVVVYDHTVNGTITMQPGMTLKFEGGRILGTTTITGSASKILNHDNKQIFNLNTTIAGTWISVRACVEWWGAVSNPTISTYSNDVMPYVGKLATSGFEAFALGGNYYVGSTLKILDPFEYTLLGNIQPHNISKLNDGGAWVPVADPTASEQTCFYSNLDINWFEVESPYVNILGGIFDISAVAIITHWCYYLNNNETVDHCTFRQTVRGSIAYTKLEGQSGGYFRWEALTGGAHTVAGHLYEIHIETDCMYVPYGVNIDAPAEGDGIGDWANGIHIKGRFTGCKMGVRHMTASWGVIDAVFSTESILAPSEKDFYQMEVSGYPVICDVFCWDLYGTEDPDNPGYWYHKNPVYSHSFGLQLQGKSLVNYRLNLFHGVKPMGIGIVNDETRIKLFKNGFENDTFISDIHSSLLNFDKEGANTVTVLGYQGTGYDFDALANRLPATATPNANITIERPQNIVSTVGYPPVYTFGTGTTDYDLDFVEIVITGEDELSYQNLFLYLSGQNEAVKRIQVIPLDVSNNIINPPAIQNQYPVAAAFTFAQYYQFDMANVSIKTLVIRLIGTSSSNGIPYSVTILDVAGQKAQFNRTFPDKHEIPKFSFRASVSQTGTSAPTMIVMHNSFHNGYVPTPATTYYNSVGSYLILINYGFLLNATFPKRKVEVLPNGDIVTLSYNTNSRYLIETTDSAGTPKNGVLVDYAVSIDRYWKSVSYP